MQAAVVWAAGDVHRVQVDVIHALQVRAADVRVVHARPVGTVGRRREGQGSVRAVDMRVVHARPEGMGDRRGGGVGEREKRHVHTQVEVVKEE